MRMRNVSETPTPVYLLAAGPRMVELAGEVADGALLFVGLHPEAIASARRHLEVGEKRANRSLKAFKTIFAVSISLDDTAVAAQRWIQSSFAPGQPWLCYPSASNLHWLRTAGFDLPDPLQPEAIAGDQAARIADAFGLFGPPERCAERLLQAREISAVEHVFLFPAHTLEGGYELPVREVEAFGRVMRPQLATRWQGAVRRFAHRPTLNENRATRSSAGRRLSRTPRPIAPRAAQAGSTFLSLAVPLMSC
jgi:5,10-methylenetetrahydromethanopterin reductase